MAAVSFNDIITKIITWIKTNGNNEITAAQLKEILIDVSNSLTEEVGQNKIPFLNADLYFEAGPSYDKDNEELQAINFALAYGAGLINYIYNKGIFTGNKEKALITKRYHDLFHKTSQWADVQIIAPLDPGTLKSGDAQDGQTLVEDQIMFFVHPTDSSYNGLYVVGAESSSVLDSWDDDYDCSIVVLSAVEGRGDKFILNANKSVQNGMFKSQEISGYVKVAAQLTILNS